MYNATTIQPIVNQGWKTTETRDYPVVGIGWSAETPQSKLEFEVEGTIISVIFYRVRKDMGIADVRVDDGSAIKMDGWFDQTWGGYLVYQLVAKKLSQGKQKLQITLLPQKAEQSNGNHFQLCAILVAGQIQ
jgi:hypothetical protein